MAASETMSSSSSITETIVVSGATSQEVVVQPLQQEKKPKQRKNKQQSQQTSHSKKSKPKVEVPFYQTLGEALLASTQPQCVYKALPPPPTLPIPIPPIPVSSVPSWKHEFKSPYISTHEIFSRSRSAISLITPRRSEDSTLSGSTKYSRDEQGPVSKSKVKGSTYTLKDFEAMTHTESLILQYGGVTHMGVRDPSYSFWMNQSKTAAFHFKVLNNVAVLGGDPLCHPDRLAVSIQEFKDYCRQAGWRTAVIGGSATMVSVAKSRGWTTMRFGTETALNPQTNEVLLGKAGKRIATQCRQLLDPSRGGITVHTYCPSLGRDMNLESDIRTIYDDWRNNRNTTRDTQAYVTVFDLFSMHSLMTFLYTKDKTGRVNGFAALRKLGANNGYHIDPFIQSADAPRGVSDLLIFASVALLNVQGCTYLSLGFEPLSVVGEISGLPSALHSTTRKVYKHVFGRIPVGGKEAFFARWKPDINQETPLYLIFVGRVPSPRFMFAMCHYTNISFRQILISDLNSLTGKNKQRTKEDVKNEKTNDKAIVSATGSPSSSPSSSDDEPQTKNQNN